MLYVPDETTGRRYEYYYWDGKTLSPNDSKSTSDDPRIDLATLDAQVMVTCSRTSAAGSRTRPAGTSASTRSRPRGPQIAAYASNEYGEGAYILATLDGTITYESTYE